MALIAMEDLQRDKETQYNARLLGYINEINELRSLPSWSDVGGNLKELESDVANARYYVVVAAYDFKTLIQTGRKDLRWVTRISVGADDNSFDKRMAQMVASAAAAFGQSGGFQRHQYGDSKVILGDTKYLGEASVKEDAKPTETK